MSHSYDREYVVHVTDGGKGVNYLNLRHGESAVPGDLLAVYTFRHLPTARQWEQRLSVNGTAADVESIIGAWNRTFPDLYAYLLVRIEFPT